MFEIEADKYGKENCAIQKNGLCTFVDSERTSKIWKDGAEFGYNKANEWHYVKDGLPKVSGRYWVYTGGEPFTLDFDTEVNAFGYWCLDVGVNLGVRDSIFETVAERDEDAVIAWKEIVLPELKESE